ncbi:hypothetical protein [Brevibacillus choshinensis]|nr:hypothetical protein [Brevibacillus choshinensis]
MSRKLTKELEPLDEIVTETADGDGLIEILDDEDIIELVMED